MSRPNNPKTKCLDNCSTQEPLVWAQNHKGSKMIFELNPHPEGKWILEQQPDNTYHVRLAGDSYEGQLYICHWDICENRQKKDDGGGARRAAAPSRRAPAARTTPDVNASLGSRGPSRATVAAPTMVIQNGEIEASVIVNGVTYYGILHPVTAEAAPASDGLDDL